MIEAILERAERTRRQQEMAIEIPEERDHLEEIVPQAEQDPRVTDEVRDMQKPMFYHVMERRVPSSGAWVDRKPKPTIDKEITAEHKDELVSAWVRKKAEVEGDLTEVTWDWDQTLWTHRNRQRWIPEFLAAFEVYWSETQIRTCKDAEMNFETGTSWVTLTLDMYFSTGVRSPAAHGGRRGLGTVKAWTKSIELLWKETRWKDPERREEH